jgi:hypothetical protein
MKKIRRITFRHESYIIREFSKLNFNLHVINFKIFNNRGRFMQEDWNIYHLYFEILNFSVSIDYEI